MRSKNEIKTKRGMYVYPMTIRRKKKKESNAMEIGSAEAKRGFESDNSFGGLQENDTEDERQGPWGIFQRLIERNNTLRS